MAITNFLPGLGVGDPQDGGGDVATCDFLLVPGARDVQDGKNYITILPTCGPPRQQRLSTYSQFPPCDGPWGPP